MMQRILGARPNEVGREHGKNDYQGSKPGVLEGYVLPPSEQRPGLSAFRIGSQMFIAGLDKVSESFPSQDKSSY